MNWTIGFLVIGALVLGRTLDERRGREHRRLPRREINRWEDEGGAVPVGSARTAAQVNSDEAGPDLGSAPIAH